MALKPEMEIEELVMQLHATANVSTLDCWAVFHESFQDLFQDSFQELFQELFQEVVPKIATNRKAVLGQWFLWGEISKIVPIGTWHCDARKWMSLLWKTGNECFLYFIIIIIA